MGLQRSASRFEVDLPRRRTAFANNGDGDHDHKAGGLSRQKTLVRPERQRSQRVPLLRNAAAGPPTARVGATTTRLGKSLPQAETLVTYTTPQPPPSEDSNWWIYISRTMTCCVWPKCMEACGMTDKAVQQAWREKAALCMIIGVLCFFVSFFTFGLKPVLCPGGASSATDAYFNQTDHISIPYRDDVIIYGSLYDFDQTARMLAQMGGIELTADWRGVDITRLFSSRPSDDCMNRLGLTPTNCSVPNPFPASPALQPLPDGPCPDPSWLSGMKAKKRLFFFWGEVSSNVVPPHALLVFNGVVLNMTSLLIDLALRESEAMVPLVRRINKGLGKDVTYSFYASPSGRETMRCLQNQYQVGYVDQESSGCAVYQTVMILMLVVIMGVVACRFLMALAFYYFFSESIQFSKYSPDYRTAASNRNSEPYHYHPGDAIPNAYPRPNFLVKEADMYTMLLVTCYSEGGDGIRGTLESLAETTYPDDHKLLFVIADGMIKGDDWQATGKTTPEVILDMIIQDPDLGEAAGKSYLAIADGAKQHNMAKVYAGYFPHHNRHVPIIVVVKCGPPSEQSAAKPGNRGKRDSQLILMNFLSRVLFDDRMTPLDHDLYRKICHITGVTPDVYETVLMVDADTRVSPMSLKHMNGAMRADEGIMGLCGETRIANKRDSWVTMIQVFEYYISHHLGKAFESVFGGVTCLPGCFCMYRITARKGATTVPLLVNPDIVEEYSENVVDTLHKKNLLLLGEDRFLTTLMLRSFPKRKMVFVPKAVCHTVVPDKFRVLLSQRRRWINSTIHNLLELVLLKDLCGIFCFSMQFVIALELLGTTILPATLISLYVLILTSTVSPQLLPLILLATTMLLPGILISLTTRKWIYVGYLLIYLLALPVWNFILPVYAFWKFDDFSWGETRRVVGEDGGNHGDKVGEYVVGSVVLKRFSEWEEERLVHEGYDPHANPGIGQRPFARALPVVPTSPLANPQRDSFGRQSYIPPGSYDPREGLAAHRLRARESYDTYSSMQSPLLKRQSDAYGGAGGDYEAGAEKDNPYRDSAQSQPRSVEPDGSYPWQPAVQSESLSRYHVAPAAQPCYDSHTTGYVAHPEEYDSAVLHDNLAVPKQELNQEKKRSWYLDNHRRKEIDSMPAGPIGLTGWIGEEEGAPEGPSHQGPMGTHANASYAVTPQDTSPMSSRTRATYQIEDVPVPPPRDRDTSGRKERRNKRRSERDVSQQGWIPMANMSQEQSVREPEAAASAFKVEIIPPTPSERSAIELNLPSSREASSRSIGRDSAVDPNRSRASEGKRSSKSKPAKEVKSPTKGPGVRAKSTLPPLKDESLGIAASKGIASTVRNFWESVGEGQSSVRRDPNPTVSTAPTINRSRPAHRPPTLVLSLPETRGMDLLPRRSSELRDTDTDLSGLLDHSFGLDVDEIHADADSRTFSFVESQIDDRGGERHSSYYDQSLAYDRSSAADRTFGRWR